MTSINQALNHQQSMIVKAPAGSGKTELLVQRYLTLLAEACDDPCQIVAITFTRKAAAEMRRRIREELERTTLPEEPHKKITYQLAQKVIAKAKQKKWLTERIITSDNVTTIDSFCHTLVSLDPLKAEFWTMPEIVMDEEMTQLYLEASENALATMQLTEENKQGLMRLLYLHSNSRNKLKASVASILSNRVAILPLINEKGYNPAAQLHLLIKELKRRLVQSAPTDILDEITKILNNNLQHCPDPPFITPDANTNWQDYPLEDWQNLSKILLTSGGTLRRPSGLNKRHGFFTGSDTKKQMQLMLEKLQQKNEWIEILAKSRLWAEEYKAEELQLVKAAQTLIKFASAHLLQIFKRDNKCDHSAIMLAAIAVMGQENSPTLLAERLGYRLRHLLVDEFQDTSYGQLQLLQAISAGWDAATPNSLFLVGDPMQSIYAFRQADVRIFNRLWDEQRLGQVPLTRITLQYNYRSEAQLVEWFNQTFAQVFPAKADNLIDAVSYTHTNPANSDNSSAISSDQTTKDEVLSHIGIIHPDNFTPSAQQLFQPIISELHRITEQQPQAKIGILTRNRNHIAGLIPLLHEAKLDFDASRASFAAANPIIMDIFTLVRGIYDIKDELAWYAMLRAPWCGLQLKDLLNIAHNENKHNLWQLIQDIAQNRVDNSVSPDGVNRIKHFVLCITPAMRERRRKSWHDVIDQAWQTLGGPTRLTSEKDLLETELIFNLLRESENNGSVLNLDAMKRQMDNLGANFESKAPIQIMTIHRSKGLEFDYVFLVSLHGGAGNKSASQELLTVADFIISTDSMSDLSDSDAPNNKLTPTKQQEVALMAIHSPSSSPQDEPVYTMIKGIKAEQQQQEYRRLFYVACTRARSRLYLHYALKYNADIEEKSADEIHSSLKNPAYDSFLSLIYKPLDENIDKLIPCHNPADTRNKESEVKIKRIASSDLSDHSDFHDGYDDIAQETSTSKTTPFSIWHPPYERCKGIIIHRLMESLACQDITKLCNNKELTENFLQKEIKKWNNLLRGKGLNKEQINQLNSIASTTLNFCLQDERSQWILKASGENASKNEWTLARKDKSSIRIDRFFEADGVKWIVDYKTSEDGTFSTEELDKYHRQLSNYAAALKELSSESDLSKSASDNHPVSPPSITPPSISPPIKIAIYCPQNGFWREWDA